MKKKQDSPIELKSYEGIRLYRDDIELILSIFHEKEYATKISDKEF
jgi:Mg2+/Co2+ transporter CorB